jgi:hypothetical protein
VVPIVPTVTHSECRPSLEVRYVLPDGLYVARKHQTPATLAVTPGLESTDAEGGLDPASAFSVRELPDSADPAPAAQTSEPAAPETWDGVQTKKSTVPVGVPPAAVPVTTALSKIEVPSATGLVRATPLESDGVVTVVVGIFATAKHSLSPVPNSTNLVAGGTGL